MSETPTTPDNSNDINPPTNPARQTDEIETIPPPPPTGTHPPVRRPARRRGGLGCWLAMIFAVLVAGGLVLAGLLLPPFNLLDRLVGPQYVDLNAEQNAYGEDGLTVVLDPADVGRDFAIALDPVPLTDFVNLNTASGDWIPRVNAAVPPTLALQSQVYDIQTDGRAPGSLTLVVDVPARAGNRDLLDVYGYYDSDGRWRFIPAQPNIAGQLTATIEAMPDRVALFQAAAPPEQQVIATVELTQDLNPAVADLATVIVPTGLTPNLRGELIGSFAPGFDVNAGYRVMPVVRNFDDPRAVDAGTVSAILANRDVRANHAQQLLAVAVNGNFDGVFVDYRGLPDDQRANFSAFVADLGETFNNAGLRVGVYVPAAQNIDGAWVTGAYDWRAIGAAVDLVIVDFDLAPQTFAPGDDRLVEAMMRWGVGEVSRYKLIAGLTALSIREVNGTFAPISYDAALAPLGSVAIETESGGSLVNPGDAITASLDGQQAVPGVDTIIRAPFIEYINDDGSTASRMWLTTDTALRFRTDQFSRFSVGGVAFRDLNDDGVALGVVDSLASYRQGVPDPSPARELALRWRLETADGVVSEIETDLNTDLVATVEFEGNVAVNVEVVAGEEVRPRSGAAVAVFQPTPTPTPLPTSTPTQTPTATPTLETIIPTQPGPTAIPGGGNTGAPPPPGNIAAGFEYGGHVTDTRSTVATNAMRQAGMTWMKVQIRYAPGANPNAAAEQINAARGQGFKILLGVVGNPGDLAAGGATYINQFGDYLAALARLNPDAIEIWNEPNLSREWPAGQISGGNYVAMLSVGYAKIKQANPNVLVISAALGPTGAEALFPGEVVNDDRFLRQMVDGGAMQYLDCVGIHYNEGIVGPRLVSGDPRDNFYTRYYQSMVNTYWGITGGQKPLCFTELGYITPEGYGNLSPFWAWGQDNTVAEQAAWLADVIAIASNSGQVQLLIVWNVDFTRFDANDPQGAFAIVRPGGGCPACAAIAGAR